MAIGVSKISPMQMILHWIGATHKFQVNLHNFEVEAGKAAVETFQKSFDLKRFNDKGSKRWLPWQGKYKGNGVLMHETGTLKNSIKVKSISNHTIHIFTDPAEFAGSSRHQNFCYAAVHNNYNTLTNPPDGPKAERQFIGHSSVLEKKLEKLSIHIFDGLPK